MRRGYSAGICGVQAAFPLAAMALAASNDKAADFATLWRNASPDLAERDSMIRHIVALRFKSDTTAQTKASLYADLAALQAVIPGVLAFHAGPNVTVEPLSRGFDDLFWFDVRDVAVRDAYLIHPAHQAIGARIVAATEGGTEGVFVFDVVVP